ncbi:MAG: DinB family protein [Phycisphaerae bacterium]|nr:DinB family protein [Phycisphaerae bacterium]
MSLGATLAKHLDGTRDWTLMLLADLTAEDWSFQPSEGLPHALWLCGHIAIAQHLLVHARCLGQPLLEDSFVAHFAPGQPVAPVGSHPYPVAGDVLKAMADVHARTLEAVSAMSDATLAEPAFGKDGATHPHYTDKCGAIVHSARHEAFHAGQLALIRRLLGKTFLR